jgi:transcriptional regulator with XRE-family HTH domain
MRHDLIQLRKAQRWSQAFLAQKLGVNQATISRIEHGKQPSKPVGLLLEQILNEYSGFVRGDRAA